MVRIAFFSIGFAFNRLVRLRFYEKIFPKDVEMFLFTTTKYSGRESDTYQQEYSLKRTEVFHLNYNKLMLPFELRKQCIDKNIDILVNVGNYMSGLVLMASTLFSKTEYIVNVFGDLFNFTNPKRIAESILLAPAIFLSKRTIFNSKINERFARFLYFPKSEIKYLPAPLNSSLFSKKDKQKARKKLGVKENEKVFIYVGRISYPKGSDVLLEVIKQNPDKKFILIGRLLDQNYDFKKMKNVLFFESIPNEQLPLYYSASDLCIFLSREEGFGMSLREAMSCGLPAIISNIKTLKHISPAIKVSFNPQEVQKKINWFFGLSKKEQTKLSEITRKFVIQECGEENIKSIYTHYYLKN